MYQRAIDTMNRLIRADLDAIRVYDKVLAGAHDEALRDKLRALRDQHFAHIDRFAPMVRDRGGFAEERGDAEGFFLEELAKLETHDRTSALHAAHHAARHAFKEYEDAMGEELELEVVHAIKDGYADVEAEHDWLDAEIHGPEYVRARRTA